MLRARLFGIPVTIEPWFWLTAALLSPGALTSGSPDALSELAAWMFVVLVSVLWHEFGHAFAFRRFGYRPEVVLRGFGGYATAPGSGTMTRTQHILVSLAGPAAGLALWAALTALLVQGVFPPASEMPRGARLILGHLLFANLWWSLLNLIPVFPLDGGQVLLSAFGPRRLRLALGTTVVVGIVTAAGLFFTFGSIFFPLLLGIMTYENYQRWKSLGGGW
jgi:Zn-dependent protease